MNKFYFSLVACMLLLTSCFEVSDEITIKPNGSGHYTRVTDYTELVQTMKTMMAMNDSTSSGDDQSAKITHTLDSTMQAQFSLIKAAKGVTNATYQVSPDSTIFTVQFDFASVSTLNKVFTVTNGGNETNPTEYFKWKKGSLSIIGGIPGLIEPATKPGQEIDESTKSIMENAKYKLSIHTGSKFKSTSNKQYKIAADKKNINSDFSFGAVLSEPKSTACTIGYK